MAGQIIYDCPVFCPSIKRAGQLVPPEFLACYNWFQDNTGNSIPKLPHRMQQKPNTPIPLSRDAGIYIPSTSRVRYLSKRYALSIHSTGNKYDDRPVIDLLDGTWLFEYAAHQGAAEEQGYNGSLMACLEDGIPVGVMVSQPKGGYKVLGLAYIERYNSVTKMFTLHGPVTKANDTSGKFSSPGFEELKPAEQKLLTKLDLSEDERIFKNVQVVRRQQQDKFRKELLDAYNSTCAITGVDVPQVLQAAHINPYRGKHTQLVTNGILLRSDMHLLFDSHLISIDPDDMKVRLSERLLNTKYQPYNAQALTTPDDSNLTPNLDLLAVHFKQFSLENKVLSNTA